MSCLRARVQRESSELRARTISVSDTTCVPSKVANRFSLLSIRTQVEFFVLGDSLTFARRAKASGQQHCAKVLAELQERSHAEPKCCQRMLLLFPLSMWYMEIIQLGHYGLRSSCLQQRFPDNAGLRSSVLFLSFFHNLQLVLEYQHCAFARQERLRSPVYPLPFYL